MTSIWKDMLKRYAEPAWHISTLTLN